MQAVQPPCHKDTLAVCVQITLKSRKTHVLNIYYPEGCSGRTEWITGLSADVDFIIVGDFNAHHALWGGTGTVSRGGGPALGVEGLL